MKKLVFIGVVLLALVGGWWWFGLPPFNKSAGPGEEVPAGTTTGDQQEEAGKVMAANTVEIKDFAFSPPSLTVKAGTTVTFANKDVTGHSATADDNSFDTGVLGQGESGTVTFGKPGTFGFHCTPHPNMKGTIIVE